MAGDEVVPFPIRRRSFPELETAMEELDNVRWIGSDPPKPIISFPDGTSFDSETSRNRIARHAFLLRDTMRSVLEEIDEFIDVIREPADLGGIDWRVEENYVRERLGELNLTATDLVARALAGGPLEGMALGLWSDWREVVLDLANQEELNR